MEEADPLGEYHEWIKNIHYITIYVDFHRRDLNTTHGRMFLIIMKHDHKKVSSLKSQLNLS